MHELSIALSIVEMATEAAEARGAARVEAVHLRVGMLSGVVPRALHASFALACEHTPLAGARLVIEEVPLMLFCRACAGARAARSAQDMACADCGTPSADLVHGRELEVVALELPA